MTQYNYQSKTPPILPMSAKYRLGDWIMTVRGIGIIFDWSDMAGYIVHLVDTNGETMEEVAVLQNELRPLMPWEIPASRRPVT